ncbi:branched-chain amino acid ABC transporter permease [Arthrobacter sp. AZCC_0090]|uniref:branched-chain amino acid ABC transporter permease n=1 Tax=Arthrobacter sp. AZCC_0090 TaxID=2735881 RepID=UPI001615F49D|nr:branched-chain amino acid ABC transporter permease [Arthrobacter sp. AZCC_0090]MBB6407123.1 branched-chain amino acid transport system permease protein [Arthrobacter sp. AZCC_0090]
MVVFVIAVLSVSAVLVPLVASVSLVYRVGGVVNFGAGYVAVFAAAACASWTSASSSLVGALMTLIAGAVVGAVTYYVAIRPAQKRGVSPIGLTLASLGVGLILNFVTRSIFGGAPTVVQPWISGTIEIFGYRTATQRILVIILAVLLLLVLWFVLDRTLVGRSLTAVSHDNELAAIYGIHGERFQLLAWVVAGICLAVGGMFQASLASVSVEVAPTLLLFSLVGSVIGGLGSLFSAVGGAVVAGAAATAMDTFIGPGLQLTGLFIVLTIVLTFRPNGLFTFRGTAERV